MALMTIIVMAVTLSTSLGLFLMYKFIHLRKVKDDYELALCAGLHPAS